LRADRHQALDLIRGLAALGVAVHHWIVWSRHVFLQSLGLFSVYVFFILSAVTMCLIYEPVFRDGIGRQEVGAFFRNRAARLLPLLAAVSIAYFLLSLRWGGSLGPELSKAVLTGTGIMALALPGYVSNSFGAWSLGTELAFYLIVPVAILMAAQASRMVLAGIFLISLCAQQMYLQLIAPMNDPDTHWAFYTAFLTFSPFFCLGFLIFKSTGARKRLALWPMLACYLGVAVFSAIWPVDLYRSSAPYLLLTALAGGAIFFAFRSEVPAWLAAPAAFLGDISYALYLTHPFTNMVVAKGAKLAGVPVDWTLPVYLVAAVSVAFLSFRLFEKPTRDFLRTGRKPALATLP
jgi:peptidoglycan/LPS O-acetylase OafA/YrhL